MAARSGLGVATRGQLNLTSRGDNSTRYGTPAPWGPSGSGTGREWTGGEGPRRPTWSGREGLSGGPSEAAGALAAGAATGSGLRRANPAAHTCGSAASPQPSPPGVFPRPAQGGNRNPRPRWA